MQLRKLHLPKLLMAVVIVGASWANLAFGLGLGEITLNSALDQPLDAEIRLLQVRDLSAEEIRIRLASQEDFRNVGLERPFALQDLRFEVNLNSPRGPVVHVTSTRPVREPFLSFLIEMQWPGGRLLREYTVLLDFPVFTEQQPAPVQPTQAQPQTPQQASSPTPPQQTTQPRPVTPAPQVAQPRAPQQASQQRDSVTTRGGVDVYGPIQANDTLWEIALKVRPDRSVSVQQTMLALQRLNPDAFIDNNINLIKRGQVLRIPDRDDILQLTQREAVSEVALQNNQWSSGRFAGGTGAELVGGRTRPTVSRDDQGPRGQVTLTSPGDTRGAGTRSGSGDNQVELETLQNELAINLEELDKSRRESTELRSRVSELEEQIETMERLIELNNEEMRKLQTALEQGDQATPDTAAAATTQSPGTEPAATEPAVQTADASSEQSASTAPADVQASTAPDTTSSAGSPAPTEQPRPAPVQARPQPEPSIFDLLMEYIYYVIAGVVVIIAGVLFALHRRSQAQMEEFDQLNEEEYYQEDLADEEPQQEDDFGLADDELDLGAESEMPFDDEEAATPTESETGDAVAEADIYIAYGKYDQAAEMLQKAIIGDPQNVNARLKLLEVYAESKDIEKFDMEYSQLLAVGDADSMTRAAELRQTIPGAGQYHGEGGAMDFGAVDDFASTENEAETFGADLGDLDLDLGDDDSSFGSAAAIDEVAAEKSPFNDDGSIDFQLDLDEDTGQEADADLDLSAELEEDTAAEQDEGGIDFSLDLDEDTSLATAADDGDLGLDLSLGDDFTAKADDLGEELSLDLEDGSDMGLEDFGQEEIESAAEDDDILADLEYSAGEEEQEAVVEEPVAEDDDDDLRLDTGFYQEVEDSDEDLLAMDSGGKEDSGLSDDFDMELGDIDLAALDQEMDALVGGLDDIDEDEEIVAAPTEVMPSIKDKDLGLDSAEVDELDEDLADLDDFDAATSLSNASNDAADEFGDDLTFGARSSGAADEGGIGEDMNAELDFLADTDEVATKLDLARAYIDMGDMEGAKDILDEVSAEGNQDQQKEAKELLTKIR